MLAFGSGKESVAITAVEHICEVFELLTGKAHYVSRYAFWRKYDTY